MSSYFKTMLNATLAHQKNNINISDKSEVIEEFLGFSATPKVTSNPMAQMPRPIQQPMMPSYAPPMYAPPMYPSMPMYPYFGMNGKKSKDKNNDDDEDDFLKMLLTAGVLGGGGALAYNHFSNNKAKKQAQQNNDDRFDQTMDALENAPKALFNMFNNAKDIASSFGYAVNPNQNSQPGIAGGLPTSQAQTDAMNKKKIETNVEHVYSNYEKLIDGLPPWMQGKAVQLASLFSGLPPNKQQQLGQRFNKTKSASQSENKPTDNKPADNLNK